MSTPASSEVAPKAARIQSMSCLRELKGLPPTHADTSVESVGVSPGSFGFES
jgi:hypothetical protein